MYVGKPCYRVGVGASHIPDVYSCDGYRPVKDGLHVDIVYGKISIVPTGNKLHGTKPTCVASSHGRGGEDVGIGISVFYGNPGSHPITQDGDADPCDVRKRGLITVRTRKSDHGVGTVDIPGIY